MNNGTITYSKTERKWIYDPVGNAPAMTFERGPAGKRQAQEAFMSNESPNVFKLVQSIEERFDPPIATRAFKAGLLVAESLVITPTRQETMKDNTILARVGSKYTVEHVIRTGDLFQCTCPDWAKGWARVNLPSNSAYAPPKNAGAPSVSSGGIMCKHIFAYQLNKQANKAMSIQNPYSRALSDKMLEETTKHFSSDFEINDILSAARGGPFGRGTWHLILDEPGKAYFQLAPEKFKSLRSYVSQRTEGSQKLVII